MWWYKWLPWKYVLRKLARSHGFTDPIALLSHVRRFSQPSEVNEPIELLRAGVVLHARGLINSRVIQHNLDWVWPYWVNQQFDPQNEAFIPRAFSLTQINLSARNWTALGLPDFSDYPIIDPRGAVMPFWDSWSIDAWIISENGELLAPSRTGPDVRQKMCMDSGLSILTVSEYKNLNLSNEARVEIIDDKYVCSIDLSAQSETPAWLAVSLRPYNPEGISFIHKIKFYEDENRWKINDKYNVFLSDMPDKHTLSNYEGGDVAMNLRSIKDDKFKITCGVGMATAAALYKLEPNEQRKIKVEIPLQKESTESAEKIQVSKSWQDVLEGSCKMSLPDDKFQYLYDAAVRSVILHSPYDVYPGPFTYKRFWFRDAAFIIYAMICAGFSKRAEKLIDNFLHRQTVFGYYHSQQGEWDSNGQVLWLMNKYYELTGNKLKDEWISSAVDAAKWIIRKRTSANSKKVHAGLLPAGFSAEHLGPIDYYYWDDFWAVEGLHAAAEIIKDTKYQNKEAEFTNQAVDLRASIEKSLYQCRRRLGRPAIPASPYRRLDSGVIGSVAASYPLEVMDPNDERMVDTLNFLMENCIINNSFYHDIIHSGINPYLTLEMAEVLMRSGDLRFADLIKGIADLASPTGQWPEAINPRTGQGCMGDGHHVWASAEWVIMMKNCFAMEQKGKLIIGAGIFPEWISLANEFSAGPIATSWGPVNVGVKVEEENIAVNVKGNWRLNKPKIQIRLPGYESVKAESDETIIKKR